MRAYGGAARDCLRAAQKEFVKAQVGSQTNLLVGTVGLTTAPMVAVCAAPHTCCTVLPAVCSVTAQQECPDSPRLIGHPAVLKYTAGRFNTFAACAVLTFMQGCGMCCTHLHARSAAALASQYD